MEEGNLSAKAKTEAWEGIPGGNLTRGSLTLHPLPWYLLNHGLSGKAPVQSCPARSQQLTGREAARFCARRNRGGIKRNGDICACHHLPGKARQGESGGTDSSRRVARPLVSSHAEPGRAARRGHTVQPVQGHTRAAACRGGTSPFKPVHDVLLLSGPCQNSFLTFRVAIKYTKL